MTEHDENRPEARYRSPFVTRWAGQQMLYNWSDLRKFRLWRSLWITLAEGEKELGLDITDEQLEQLRKYRDEINLEVAREREKQIRHDVMAHVYAYGQQCPDAQAIIHLGATSAYVGDNADLVRMRDALRLLVEPLASACSSLAEFAEEYKDMPCLARTHYQPAQLTTVGKRACLWLQDLLGDLQQLRAVAENMPFRGVKGTTGTQASFLRLFDGDSQKVKELDRMVAEKMGFSITYPVTGQTYPRKLDYTVLTALGGLATSLSKMAADIRLLAGQKEVEEPFKKEQVGSSAMAYKRNPMRCERMTALCRFILNNVQNAAFTASEQWMERTLDDSANRRLSLAEGFLAADSVARLAANIADGLVVNEKVVGKIVEEELPFMATENILMEAVKAGGDRQELHERIRQHSMEAARQVKQEGGANDLLERIAADEAFSAVADRMDELVNPADFVGRAPRQVEEFLEDYARPVLAEYAHETGGDVDLRV